MYIANGLLFLSFGFTLMKCSSCFSDITLVDPSRCGNMLVDHSSLAAQSSDPPFKIAPDYVDVKASGEIFTVTLSANPEQFNGFLLEARKCESCEPDGTFTFIDTSNSAVVCNGRAVGHIDNVAKSSVSMQWTATNTGVFFFRAAFTQSFIRFWQRQEILTTTSPQLTSPQTSPTTTTTTTMTFTFATDTSTAPLTSTATSHPQTITATNQTTYTTSYAHSQTTDTSTTPLTSTATSHPQTSTTTNQTINATLNTHLQTTDTSTTPLTSTATSHPQTITATNQTTYTTSYAHSQTTDTSTTPLTSTATSHPQTSTTTNQTTYTTSYAHSQTTDTSTTPLTSTATSHPQTSTATNQTTYTTSNAHSQTTDTSTAPQASTATSDPQTSTTTNQTVFTTSNQCSVCADNPSLSQQSQQYMKCTLALLLFSRLCFLGGSSLLMIIRPVSKKPTKTASVIELAAQIVAVVLILIKAVHYECADKYRGLQTAFTALTVTAMVLGLLHTITVFLHCGPSHELRKCWLSTVIIVDLLNTCITTAAIFHGIRFFRECWLLILMGVSVFLELLLYLGSVYFKQKQNYRTKRERREQNLTNKTSRWLLVFIILLVFNVIFIVALIIGVSLLGMTNFCGNVCVFV